MKVLIIGGVAGGASTAARLRRNDEKAEIILLERGNYISYANCGLPYYLGDVIKERERLFVQTPEQFQQTFNIEVRTNTEALHIDVQNKILACKNLLSGEEYTEAWDELVLSPGAEPLRPPIPGIQAPEIFTLRNVSDTDSIYQFIQEKKPKKVAVVGAGFIGLEMAENLKHRGLEVYIIEMASQVMTMLDPEIAAEVHQHIKSKNLGLFLNDGVAAFEKKAAGSGLTLLLKSSREISVDFVILSIGVRPDTKLAKDSGIELGASGGIKVNQYLETSAPHVHALGDAIEFPQFLTGKPVITYLAGPANKQGRIVADNLAFGPKSAYRGALGTAVAKVFDITVASSGLNEKQLQTLGYPYTSVITHSSSHAGYYPGAMPMSIKTLFNSQDGTLYGAQIVGYEGVDKRIDLFASVLSFKGNISDLTQIEHAYAPPFSSAKDPVNIAGFVAENVLSGKSKHIQWHEIQGCGLDELFLIDVRTPEEFALGTIEGAVNIPTYALRNQLDKIPQDKTLVVFCGVGLRAYQAERILRNNGFSTVYNLSGGYKTWSLAVQKQSNDDIFASDWVGKDDVIYQENPQEIASLKDTGMVLPYSGETKTAKSLYKIIEVDATGLQCPGPILKLKKAMDEAAPGEAVSQKANDPGFLKDVQSWCNMTGNKLLKLEQNNGIIQALIQKPLTSEKPESDFSKNSNITLPKKIPSGDETTMVVFSDALDKALASFVIANGAASSGKKVTLFFTFWGLSIIKKAKKPRSKKDFMGKMFSLMLPSFTQKLGLSKINMGGMGAGMMRSRMKALGIDSLESMIQSAIDSGVKLVACQMSMDVMGVTKEELFEGVEIGGVASYLDYAGSAGINLFI